MKLGLLSAWSVPQKVIAYRTRDVRWSTYCRAEGYQGTKVRRLKNIVHQVSHEVNISVADLDEAGAGFVEEFLGEEEAVAEIGEIEVDGELPRGAEGSDHV